MDWDVVWNRLEGTFAEVMEKARVAFPNIQASAGRARAAFAQFEAYATFVHDPVRQEHEDLVLWFSCGLADRGPFWDSEGHRSFPQASEQDAAGFSIERGDGLDIAVMDPILLPLDRDSSEYERAVLEYTNQAARFIRDRMDLILEALREPFEPPAR